jgi:hypothetical protein
MDNVQKLHYFPKYSYQPILCKKPDVSKTSLDVAENMPLIYSEPEWV